MSIVANRTGRNAVVTITVDVQDIVAAVGNNPHERKTQVLRRVLAELTEAVNSHSRDDAEIDAEAARIVTEAAAAAARKKALRPTGTL